MPATRKSPRPTRPEPDEVPLEEQLQSTLEWLKKHGSKATRDGMARYAVPSTNAFGVTMAQMKVLAAQLGQNQELAEALWTTGWYEARMLTSFVADPARMSSDLMDRWCDDFDNWGICDTVCFHLFDRTSHAWEKVERWQSRSEEFVKRAAFALLWGLTVHDKTATDAPFLRALDFVESAAGDERNFVKKAVNMALRATGKRNRALNEAAIAVSRRLAATTQPTARWVGKNALTELTSASVVRRLDAQRTRA